MSDTGPQYQINEPARGIRFYNGTPIIGIQASFSIQTNVSTIVGRINTISISSQSISSNLTISAGKLVSFDLSLEIDTDIQVSSIELLKLLSYMAGSVTLTSSGTKKALASSNQSFSLDTTSIARQIFYSESNLDSSLEVFPVVKKIISAQANLSNILSFSVSEFTIFNSLFPSQMSISSGFLIADIIRFTTGERTPGSLVPLLLLDNMPLTDQNRKFDDSFKPVFVENKNWNNTKSRYYKRANGGKTSFRISWDWLPSDRESTIDKRFARDFISEKAMDPDIHTLTVITYGENPEDVFEKTDYNVFISSYSENLIRRDLSSEVYFWSCSLDLEEA